MSIAEKSASRLKPFVRHDPIPAAPPPLAHSGAARWLRENLFSTPGNTVMTVVSVYALYWLAMQIGPWIVNGVWSAESIRDCRAQLDGRTGGCFAVIAERWPQLVFGNYPSRHYGRASLAFIMLFVALAPLLFMELPRKMLWFTGLFPFIAYWLIWGGTLWLPILTLAGLVAGVVVYTGRGAGGRDCCRACVLDADHGPAGVRSARGDPA